PAEKYRVVRQEEVEGRTLTVVDVVVPMNATAQSYLYYRAWLDLERGAVPMKLYEVQRIVPDLPDNFEPRGYYTKITTHEAQELPNGAFYPTKTVAEDWQNDPDRHLTAEEWAEVREGKREAPPVVVFRRNTWQCTLVEIKDDFDDGFF